MEGLTIEHLSFSYPTEAQKALEDIHFSVKPGEMVLLCGCSGCGKTTLLRLLKPTLAPFGNREGQIYLNDRPIDTYSVKEQASGIGFVMQNPDHQLVTDKVWHELAFGLESLGYSTAEIRTRVSEMASFFGIQSWFYRKVTELSGGQKQLLNLASVMVMQPSVLLLDEPTSQLDPIAAQDFFKVVEKINRELGTTVIVSEQRLEEVFQLADRVVVLDKGRVVVNGAPRSAGAELSALHHPMYAALPASLKIHTALCEQGEAPLTVREGRQWLIDYAQRNQLQPERIPTAPKLTEAEPVLEVREAWFRYEKKSPDVIKGLNLTVYQGEMLAVVGGNGTGKTTALSLLSGLLTPYRGQVLLRGETLSSVRHLYDGLLGVLPQNPQCLFVEKTVFLDLMEIFQGRKISETEKQKKVEQIAAVCHIEPLLQRHPYDLSGGEQQRVALAKVLLTKPSILLLDEPTKGMDAQFKREFSAILNTLKQSGVTIVMVSHDIEFCAAYADRCAMFFDGMVTSEGEPRAFFGGKAFYTTAANRMARSILPKAVLTEDVIMACGRAVQREPEEKHIEPPLYQHEPQPVERQSAPRLQHSGRLTPLRVVVGSAAALFFACVQLLPHLGSQMADVIAADSLAYMGLQGVSLIAFLVAFVSFFPSTSTPSAAMQQPKSERRLTKRTRAALIFVLLAVPLTIYIGVYFLGNKKYYFISLLIILETLLPFALAFESRRPQARELVVVSVLCALTVAGRAAFYMLPEFKPVTAMVVIAGVCFGGETGFLVGAASAFVSNFFFGQGPWTPWQMFAFGIIGFLAGVLFQKGLLRKTKASLSVFGFLAALLIYGGIMNSASVIMWQNTVTGEMLLSAYVMGLPFDLIHALATAFFLWFMTEPMLEKLERIKVKYGLLADKHSS